MGQPTAVRTQISIAVGVDLVVAIIHKKLNLLEHCPEFCKF